LVVPVGNNVHNKDSFTITGLWPGMRYMLRVTATNSAGTTVAEYTVTTLPVVGGSNTKLVSLTLLDTVSKYPRYTKRSCNFFYSCCPV